MKTIIVYDGYNQRCPPRQDIIGTITSAASRNNLKAGWHIIEIEYEDTPTDSPDAGEQE